MKSYQTPFSIGSTTLHLDDAIAAMSHLEDDSFDLAIADPPYGASTKATWKLPKDHNVEGFGGAWRLASHSWDLIAGADGFEMTLQWLSMLKRLVKPTGSIWIHSTYHNSGIINVACQILGLEIINEVVWFKRNAFPNLARRRLTASHETILWVHTGGKKRQYYFNYEKIKSMGFEDDRFKEAGKQLRTVWDIPNNKAKEELLYGSHPTQKPLRLTQRLLLISAKPGGKLLVPFAGSGTEIVAAERFGLQSVGFEIDKPYFNIACKRIEAQFQRQDLSLRLQPAE